jgi:BirA family biotin operon repressor/biotin-[acetyl-CoA-carboxylase] ligase
VERDELLIGLITRIRECLEEWPTDAYAAACVTVGRAVRVELPDGSVLEGDAVAVDASGRLVVEAADGRHHVGAGDVVHVR